MSRFLLLSIFLTLTLHAGGIRWHGTYDNALEEALKEEKPMLVFLIKPNDPQGHKMLATTLRDQPYIEWINRHFVSVLITEGTKNSYPLELLYTLTYPALFFLTSHELFLCDPIIGAVDAATLERHLNNLTDSIKN